MLIFLFILIFAPLAFGAVETWSLATAEALCFAAFLYHLLHVSRDRGKILHVPGLLPLLLLLAWTLFQITPLPAFLLNILSPETMAVYRETAGIDAPVAWATISLFPKGTAMEFFRLAAGICLYILTVQLLARKDRFSTAVTVAVSFAAVLSFYSIIQMFLSPEKIYFFREAPPWSYPFGPYVNRNHYAGLIGMICPLAFALFLYHRPSFGYGSFRDRVRDTVTSAGANAQLLSGFAGLLMATSLFLTLSRGAIVCFAASMLFFAALSIRSAMGRRTFPLLLLLLILALLSGASFGWDPLLERFGNLRSPAGELSLQRPQMWRDTAGIISDFPLTGTGFGSFAEVYPRYRSLPYPLRLPHAHNDYLELVADGGIVAAFLTASFLVAVLFQAVRAFLGRRDRYAVHIFVGCTSGLLYLFMYSLVDFNLHIGANALYFFFLLGLFVSAAHTSFQRTGGNGLLKASGLPLTAAAAAGGVLLLSGLLFNGGILAGGFFGAPDKERNAARAAQLDPLEGEHRYLLADRSRALGEGEAALKHLSRAIRLRPVSSSYLQRRGLIYSDLGEEGMADNSFRAGLKYDRSNPVRYRIYGSWLISRGRRREGIVQLREAAALLPGRTDINISQMILAGLDDDEIHSAFDGLAEPLIHFGEYLVGTGDEEKARAVYGEALLAAMAENEKNSSLLHKIYIFYYRRGLYEEALGVIRSAVDRSPGDARLRIIAAELYTKMGIGHRAEEEYRAALIIDPGSDRARKGLQKLQTGPR